MSVRLHRPAPVHSYDGFLMVELSGGPYERGQQHGLALAERIREMRDRLYGDIIFAKGRALGAMFAGVLYGILARMHPFIPRELREEMRGVADGAKVQYRDILLINCFDDVLHALIQLNPVLTPLMNHRFVKPVLGFFACSSFVLTGSRTITGAPIHGRNLDYLIGDGFVDPDGIVPKVLRDNLTVFVVQPARGRPFASVAWPGFVGSVTTLNADGVSLACLTSTVARERADGTPLILLYRLMAQYGRSLDEAEWLLRGARRTIGNNLTVATADDEARLFEFTMDQIAAIRPKRGLIAATNHFQEPSMTEAQIGWVVPNSELRLSRLRDIFGVDRSTGMEARGESDPRVGIAEARAALLDTCLMPDATSTWDCLFNPGTIYNSMSEPARLVLWLHAYDRPDRGWVELDLSEPLAASRATVAA
ncbi:MAG: hypothetical protein IT305_21540 [Chloroflexi bacterium]|nr:hypothetical protein [Chloroflexota bacterium]